MNKAENKFEKYKSKYGLDRYNPLSDKDATKRLKKYGYNDIYELSGNTPSKVLFRLLYDPVSILLLVCSLILVTSKHYYPSLLVFLVWLINNIITITLYYRSEIIYRVQRTYCIPRVKVYRDMKVYLIDSRLIVPGDIIIIESGDIVCADCKLLWAENLRVYEKDLTGSDEICRKYVSSDNEAIKLSDMHGSIFASSCVISGSAIAQVIKTGHHTEIVSSCGKIPPKGKEYPDLFFDVKKQCRSLGIITTIAALLLFFIRILVNPIRLFDIFLFVVALISSSLSESLLPISQILAAKYIHNAANSSENNKVIIKNAGAIDSLAKLSIFVLTDEIIDAESMYLIDTLRARSVKCIICSLQKNAFNLATKYGAVVCKDLNEIRSAADTLTVYIADSLAARADLITQLKRSGEFIGVLTTTHRNVRLLGLADVSFTYGNVTYKHNERFKADINNVKSDQNQIVSSLSDVICDNNVSSVSYAQECARSIHSAITDAASYLISAQFFRLIASCISVIFDVALMTYSNILICGMLLDLAVVLFISYIKRKKTVSGLHLGRSIGNSILMIASLTASWLLFNCIPFLNYDFSNISYTISTFLFMYATYYVTMNAIKNDLNNNISTVIMFLVLSLIYIVSVGLIPSFALLVGVSNVDIVSFSVALVGILLFILISIIVPKFENMR